MGRTAAPFPPNPLFQRQHLYPAPYLLLTQQLPALLTRQTANDLDRLMNPRRGAETQLRLVITFQSLVVMHQRFAEQFEGPDIALEGGNAFVLSHGPPDFAQALGCPGYGWGRNGGVQAPARLGGGERMRGS